MLGEANTAEGAASGTWTVETAFPPKAMDAFIDAVINGEVNPHDGMIIGNAGKRMIEGVIAANGDTDAQRSIVAVFVKEEGHRAVQAIRTNTAGDQTYLALAGSNTFVGVGGYAHFEDKFRAIEATASAESYDAALAYQDVEALSRAEHARLRDLQDFGKYADVPASLRLTERLRVEDNIARLTDLKAIIGMAIVEGGGGQAIIDPASVDSDNGNFADAFDDAKDANREMERTYDSARARRIIHENQGGRDNLGRSGIFGFAAGPEYQAYAKIDGLWGGAEFYRRAGTEHEDNARSFTRTDVSDASASVEFWLYAADHYLAANREFLRVIDGYRGIESRHASSVGYWT